MSLREWLRVSAILVLLVIFILFVIFVGVPVVEWVWNQIIEPFGSVIE